MNEKERKYIVAMWEWSIVSSDLWWGGFELCRICLFQWKTFCSIILSNFLIITLKMISLIFNNKLLNFVCVKLINIQEGEGREIMILLRDVPLPKHYAQQRGGADNKILSTGWGHSVCMLSKYIAWSFSAETCMYIIMFSTMLTFK